MPDPRTWEIPDASDEEKNAFWEMLPLLYDFLQKANHGWLRPMQLSGQPALVEYNVGRVSRVTGPVISVCYGEGEDAFESEYEISQFCQGLSINRGDRIEAVIGLWHQKHQLRDIDQIISPEEVNELDGAWQSQKNVVVGDLKI